MSAYVSHMLDDTNPHEVHQVPMWCRLWVGHLIDSHVFENNIDETVSLKIDGTKY